MSVYRRGRFYHYEFWYRGVRYRGATGQVSKVAARRVEEEKLKDLREGVSIRDIAFDQFAKLYLDLHAAGKKAQNFYKCTTDVLVAHFGKTMLSRIGVREIEAFVAERRKKVGPATTNRSIGVLKHMFNKAIDWGHARTNPVRRVKMAKEPRGRERYLTEREVQRLLDATPEKVRPIVTAALHTGARRGELVKLDWQDVDFGSGTVHFRDTKSGKDRAVPMDDTLRALLKAQRSRLAGGAVFTAAGGGA